MDFELFGILFLTVVAPIWIVFHYLCKIRSSKALTSEDETMLSQVWDSANRMEERIETLERILDADAPGWRRRHQQ